MPIHPPSCSDGCRESSTRSATAQECGRGHSEQPVLCIGRETSNLLLDQRLARQASDPEVGVLSASPFGPLAGTRNQQHRNATGPSYLQPQTADLDGPSDGRRASRVVYRLQPRSAPCGLGLFSYPVVPDRTLLRRLAGSLTQPGPTRQPPYLTDLPKTKALSAPFPPKIHGASASDPAPR